MLGGEDVNLNETVLETMRHINNFFHFDKGKFTISDDRHIALTEDFVTGDWIAITGNRQLSGIYFLSSIPPLEAPLEPYAVPHFRLSNGTDNKNPVGDIKSFSGAVNLLIPQAGFIQLCREINIYVNEPENFPTAKTGESVIGAYSWTKSTGANGKPLTVFQVFADRLASFRQMFTTFNI